MRTQTITAIVASGAGLASAMATSHQLCQQTSFFEKGNWYCKAVQLITYENVGRPGQYNDVVNMDQETGECQFAPKAFSGPLAPFNEPMSVHFRGPLQLKQFAVYLPNLGQRQFRKNKKRSDDVDEGEEAPVINNYLSLYEHAEEEREAYEAAHPEETQRESNAARRIKKRDHSYTHGPLKDASKQGRIKRGTTLVQLPDGSVGFWAQPHDDSIIYRASPDEFEFLWDNVHKLTLKVSPPVPADEFLEEPSEEEYSLITAGAGHLVAPKDKSTKSTPEPALFETYPIPESWRQQLRPDAPSHQPSKNPTLEDHNPPGQPFSAVHTPKLRNVPLVRSAYYNSARAHSAGLTFLGNYGGQEGSGAWSLAFGNSLSYINSAASAGSSTHRIPLPNLTLPSGGEFAIFSDQPCHDDGSSASASCGYVRPGAVAYQGFGSSSPNEPDKLFLLEFSMPHDGSATAVEQKEDPYSQADMPAVWMLNARIPLTAQYHSCSCWKTGCGEFDVLEVLAPGSDKAKSTFHSVLINGGDANYFKRPSEGSVTVAVVFDSVAGMVSVKMLNSEPTEFPTRLGVEDIKRYWNADHGLYGHGGEASAYRFN